MVEGHASTRRRVMKLLHLTSCVCTFLCELLSVQQKTTTLTSAFVEIQIHARLFICLFERAFSLYVRTCLCAYTLDLISPHAQ